MLSNCKPPKRKNASYDWLHDGSVIIGRRGVIKDAPRNDSTNTCRVLFGDGLEESIPVNVVVKGAFACLVQGIGLDHQYVWPVTKKLDDAVHAVKQEVIASKRTNKAERGGRKASTKRVSIKLDDEDENDYEPVDGHNFVFKTGFDIPAAITNEDDTVDKYQDDLDSDFRFIGKEKVARPLPPGIPNMLWHALNCPEAKTGYNMLQDLLCVHDRVPGHDVVSMF